jgi:hypothetical protein
MRGQVVKLKRNNPSMRFRIESNLGPHQSLTTSKASTQGLEAPESFFVELSEYEAEYGAPKPDEVVQEVLDGKLVQGVSCQILLICFFLGVLNDNVFLIRYTKVQLLCFVKEILYFQYGWKGFFECVMMFDYAKVNVLTGKKDGTNESTNTRRK